MSKLDEILGGLIAPETGNFSAELARHVLAMRFTDDQANLYESLAERNQAALLSSVELEELDAFVTANMLLMVLKSKARRSLIEPAPAA